MRSLAAECADSLMRVYPMADTEDTTLELLRRAADGDSEALDEALSVHRERLKPMVRLRLNQLLRARVDESDVVQEVLLDASPRCNRAFTARGNRTALVTLDHRRAPHLVDDLPVRRLALLRGSQHRSARGRTLDADAEQKFHQPRDLAVRETQFLVENRLHRVHMWSQLTGGRSQGVGSLQFMPALHASAAVGAMPSECRTAARSAAWAGRSATATAFPRRAGLPNRTRDTATATAPRRLRPHGRGPHAADAGSLRGGGPRSWAWLASLPFKSLQVGFPGRQERHLVDVQ